MGDVDCVLVGIWFVWGEVDVVVFVVDVVVYVVDLVGV